MRMFMSSITVNTHPSLPRKGIAIWNYGFKDCLAFNPFNKWIVAMGSADRTVTLHDIRKLDKVRHTCAHHVECSKLVGIRKMEQVPFS